MTKKLLYVLIAVSLITIFLSTTTRAAITFDASSSKVMTATALITSTLTVGNGTNELFLILNAQGNNTSTLSGVTVDGVNATFVASGSNGGAQNRHASLYYVVGLSAGAHNVSTTYNGANTQAALMIASFFGVNQSTPLDASSSGGSNTGTTAPSSTLTTTVANDLVVDVLDTAAVNGTSSAAGAGQIFIVQNATSGGNTGNSSYQLATATGSYKDSYTTGGSAWSMAMGAFQPAAAVGGATNATQNSMGSGIFNVNTTLNVSNGLLVQ